jgi:cytoskeleton protein RodZ
VSEAPLTVGQTVARARGAAGMTLAQVAEATRIRATVIGAIENDDFRLCGGDVYARGHLKSIARAVGADGVALAEQFDREQGTARTASAPVAPIDQPTRVMQAGDEQSGLGALAGTLGSSVSSRRGANWTAVMALAVVALIAVGAVSLLSNRTADRPTASSPTSSSTPAPIQPSSTPSSSPTSEPTVAPSSTPSTPDVVAEGNGVTVNLSVTGRASWVRATSDSGKTLFEGTLRNGDTKTFRDKTKVKLLLGNAGAVSLVVNGKDLGSPGSGGQVLKAEFGPGDPANPVA